MRRKISNVTEEAITAPAIHKFPQLPDIDGTSFATWGWHLFVDLDHAALDELRTQGYNQPQNDSVPDYASFIAFIAGREDAKFTWLSLSRPHSSAKLYFNENSELCKFGVALEPDELYVPAGWGSRVLDLVKMGIVKIKKTNSASGWQWIHWNSEIVDCDGSKASKTKIIFPDKDDYLLEVLQDLGFLKAEDKNTARAEAKTAGKGALEILLGKGIVTKAQVVQAKAAHFGAEVVDIAAMTISPEVIAMVPASTARKYQVIPIEKKNDRISITIADPSDLNTLDSLTHLLNAEITTYVTSEEDIAAALTKYYPEAPFVPPQDNTCPRCGNEMIRTGSYAKCNNCGESVGGPA